MITTFKIVPAVDWNNCERGDKVRWIVYDADKYPEQPLLCDTLERACDYMRTIVATDKEILDADAEHKMKINEQAKLLRQKSQANAGLPPIEEKE